MTETVYSFTAIVSLNPYQLNIKRSVPVVAFVGALFLVFICGLVYFIRNVQSNDEKDQSYDSTKRKENLLNNLSSIRKAVFDVSKVEI
jgi:hypothetical protein